MEESKDQLTIHNVSSTSSHPLTNANTATTMSMSVSSSPPPPPSDLQIRPSYANLFKPRQVESLIRQYVEEFLSPRQYDPNETSNWAKELAANIKNRLKGPLPST